MFQKDVYINRRKKLASFFSNGILLFPGNLESAMNYAGNTYHFRQDSTFLYFFGLDLPGFTGVIDIDSGNEILFGNDFEMDDIIWMGPQPAVKDLAESVGVKKSIPFSALKDYLQEALKKGKVVHYLPPYRGETILQLYEWLGIPIAEIKQKSSVPLIKAVVDLRSVKADIEIKEIEAAIDITREMHITAMTMAKPGVYEYEIAGKITGIPPSHNGELSFPIILSINGQTLHNHYHGNKLKEGRMLVVDAGAESSFHYSGDITRTVPVGGKFSTRQREIYEIVLKANTETIMKAAPGVPNLDQHLLAARIIASGLKDLGLMKGDVEEAVRRGAHTLFFPHGLGHMMGLDVHDMENLGEDYVGYDDTVTRSSEFGLAYLRLAKKLKPGYVLTIEPGIYFIPALIDLWKSEKKHVDFIEYQKVETYKDYGGTRIEDNILITAIGARELGKPIPKTVKEIEEVMK
jgi:Xaa-Pro aminopeptidase